VLALLKGDFDADIFNSIQTKYVGKFGRLLDLIPVNSSNGISIL